MAAPPKDFSAMFGGTSNKVDYATEPTRQEGPLPLPEDEDNLNEIAEKMQDLAKLVTDGS